MKMKKGVSDVDGEKRQISVKLNGKKQHYEEKKTTPIPPIQQEPEPKPVAAADNSKKEESASPDIIDFRERQTERKKRDQPFWDDGNNEYSPKLPFKRKKKKPKKPFQFSLKSFPLSIVLAGISAVVVGVSFGLVILTIFTGESEATGDPNGQAVPTVAEVVAEGKNLPDLTVEIVQGGAFSTIEKGEEIVDRLKDRGHAAVLIESSDPHYMFIGVAQDKEYANGLSQLYQQEGQDTYVKPFAVLGGKVDAGNEDTGVFFQDGMAIYNELMLVSIRSLAGDKEIITDKSLEIVVSEHQKWTDSKGQALDGLSEESKAEAERYVSAITEGVETLQSIDEDFEENKFWHIQQSLLDATLAYDSFIDTLK
ncbi:hypothetical protein [Alkalihalobacterium bogoriense]|uniref:hypothetical protein n=1 Tax=Alkalihalobacterium bogoriense TaxID=246272 RepID=UPI0012EC4B1F|nr:hypothetical protein [Alkalihalobacterium bogoriense]